MAVRFVVTNDCDRGEGADRPQADHDDDLARVTRYGMAYIAVEVSQADKFVHLAGRATDIAAEVWVFAAFADEVVRLRQHSSQMLLVLLDARAADLGAAVG